MFVPPHGTARATTIAIFNIFGAVRGSACRRTRPGEPALSILLPGYLRGIRPLSVIHSFKFHAVLQRVCAPSSLVRSEQASPDSSTHAAGRRRAGSSGQRCWASCRRPAGTTT